MKGSQKKHSGRIWHKVTMSVDRENAEMVRRAIQSCHCCGIQSEDEGTEREQLDAYFDNAIDPAELQAHMKIIAALLSAAGGRELKLGKIETIPEEDWLEEWRKNWKPVRVTERLVICPSWEKFPKAAGETVVYIYPKMAFGTGSHPTTQLCLKLIDRYMPKGARILDVGSGSGILAIAAAKMGARRVVAVEMDETAIENAIENCRFNRVMSKVKLLCEPFGPKSRGEFDLGVCNMLAHEMLPLIPDINRVLNGKSLILSGLTAQSAPPVKKALAGSGWQFRRTLADGEWRGFYAVHNSLPPT